MGKTADIQETILDIKMELMTVEEVAKVFNVKSHTVRNWIRRGQIPKETTFKIGATLRIKRKELESFIFKTA